MKKTKELRKIKENIDLVSKALSKNLNDYIEGDSHKLGSILNNINQLKQNEKACLDFIGERNDLDEKKDPLQL